MEKLLLIDGSGLLFQSFYGMPKQIVNKEGKRVEAVVCFVGILLKQLKLLKPNAVLVVFDGENELERKKIDEGYKANRVDYSNVEDTENPFSQLEDIKLVLDNLNIKWVETDKVEADDLIASIVNDYKSEQEIIISSADKDFYQLIDDTVSVFTYRGKKSKLWDKGAIIEKYGFAPKYFSSLKALMGDKSDNIKGVKGIGIKTATALVQEFGTLENIFSQNQRIKPKIRALIFEEKEKLLKNYKIVELHSKKGIYRLNGNKVGEITMSSGEILRNLNIL